MLFGRPVGVRQVVALGAAAVAVLLGVAFLDLARPEGTQTHLARLAEHVAEGRWDTLADSLGRRWSASFGSGEVGAWVLLVTLTVGVALYLLLVATGRAGATRARWTSGGPVAAAALGLTVLAGLGLVANDSSFAVPATMLLVVVPVLVHRAGAGATA